MSADGREALTAADGRTVLTFLRGTRDGLPAADVVEPAAGVPLPEVADAALAAFPDWAFSAPPDLGRILLARGATTVRHAHWMARDLVTDPPEPAWAALAPAEPDLHVDNASLTSEDYLASSEAAYQPEHADYEARESPEDRMAHDITPLLDGTLGPLLGASAVVRDEQRASAIVAACLVTDRPGDGPWIVEVYRRPEPCYAGLGSLLLRRAMARLVSDGFTELGLAVTEGNPARRTYDRLGFRLVQESLTVHLPALG